MSSAPMQAKFARKMDKVDCVEYDADADCFAPVRRTGANGSLAMHESVDGDRLTLSGVLKELSS